MRYRYATVPKSYVYLKIIQKVLQISKKTLFWFQICSLITRHYTLTFFNAQQTVSILSIQVCYVICAKFAPDFWHIFLVFYRKYFVLVTAASKLLRCFRLDSDPGAGQSSTFHSFSWKEPIISILCIETLSCWTLRSWQGFFSCFLFKMFK